MRVQKTHAAALGLAAALVVTAATPSLALDRWGAAGVGFAAGAVVGAAAANANAGYYYGPGYGYAATSGYAYAPAYRPGWSAHAPNFDPENGSDPDPRIGGSVKMNSSGDD